MHDSILALAPLQERSLPTHFLYGSSFALRFQSNTAENIEFFQFPVFRYVCLYTVNNFLRFLLLFIVDFSR